MKNAKIAVGLILVVGAASALGFAQLGKAKKIADRTVENVEERTNEAAPQTEETQPATRNERASRTPKAAEGDVYEVDPGHSTVLFRIQHARTSNFWGRINDLKGEWTFDPNDPTSASFEFELRAAKIDTDSSKRDSHLKSADFFNASQFPRIEFKSTAVTKTDGDLFQLEGDMTLLGETKPITAELEWLGTGNFNGKIAAFEARFTIKRSDFGMSGMVGPLGDEVYIIVAAEGKSE